MSITTPDQMRFSMKLKYAAFIALWLSTHSLFAQGLNVTINGVGISTQLDSYDEIAGSPYLSEEWSKAEIHLVNGGVKNDIPARFNVFEKELEVVNEEGIHLFLDKNTLDHVLLTQPTISTGKKSAGSLPELLFKKGFGFVKGVEDQDLVNVLSAGEKYTLIRKFTVKLVHPEKSSYGSGQGSKFVSEVEFFLIRQDGKTLVVNNRNSSILKAIDTSDLAAANQLIKERSLDLSRDDHLAEFFLVLNQASF